MQPVISIIGGTGAEGRGLALRFALAGARVRIGSRDAARARLAADAIRDSIPGADVTGFENGEAVREATIAVLTVPPEAQIETLESLRHAFQPGTVLVDATVRLKSTENSALIAGEHVPAGVTVASAFHTLSASLLSHIEEPVDSDILICCDSAQAKAEVGEVAALLQGARAVDAGGLRNSRLVENAVQLLIALNRANKAKHCGIRVTGI